MAGHHPPPHAAMNSPFFLAAKFTPMPNALMRPACPPFHSTPPPPPRSPQSSPHRPGRWRNPRTHHLRHRRCRCPPPHRRCPGSGQGPGRGSRRCVRRQCPRWGRTGARPRGAPEGEDRERQSHTGWYSASIASRRFPSIFPHFPKLNHTCWPKQYFTSRRSPYMPPHLFTPKRTCWPK